MQIIVRYMAASFSLVVSDTTGNVKKCRRLICNKWPWILNCPDPCHQLNLMMKDIMLGSKKYGRIVVFSQVWFIHTYFVPNPSNDISAACYSQWQLFLRLQHTSPTAITVSISSKQKLRSRKIQTSGELRQRELRGSQPSQSMQGVSLAASQRSKNVLLTAPSSSTLNQWVGASICTPARH